MGTTWEHAQLEIKKFLKIRITLPADPDGPVDGQGQQLAPVCQNVAGWPVTVDDDHHEDDNHNEYSGGEYHENSYVDPDLHESSGHDCHHESIDNHRHPMMNSRRTMAICFKL